jgi:hypothetical protein
MLNEFERMPTDLNPLPLQCPTWSEADKKLRRAVSSLSKAATKDHSLCCSPARVTEC